MGGYFGGRLAQAGENVTFIARGAHLQAIRDHGLKVQSVAGDFEVSPARVEERADQVGPVDYVLLGVKAWQVPQVAAELRPMVGADTAVVPLQNGVEAPDQLAAVLGRQHVLGGLCVGSMAILGPGQIIHKGLTPSLSFGELDGGESSRVEGLKTAYERAGVAVQTPPDIRVAMWQKFLFIVGWSAVGAATRAPIGVLRARPETRLLLDAVFHETLHVGQALGVDLTEGAVQRAWQMIEDATPETIASMQRDLMAGRPSELDEQPGALLRLGARAGVATPITATLYAALKPQEMRARGEVAF